MPDALKPLNLDDPVAGSLRRDFTRFPVALTVAEAVERLRAEPGADAISYFYAVGEGDRLEGVVPARNLIVGRADQLIGEVMVREVVTLPEGATVADACRAFTEHRLLAIPVVDSGRRLLGLVDVQLYTDELERVHHAGGRDDLFSRIGVHVAGAEQRSPVRAFRERFPWLTVNLAGGIACAALAGVFEGTLNKVVALAFFIPVVLNMAESVSAQSVSLALHLLAGEKPTWKALAGRVGGELATGSLLGAASGAAVGAVALAWQGRADVALVLLGAIGLGVTISAAVGVAVPMVLRLMRLDPRVAAGPVALAVADVLTIASYFGLARLVLG